VAGDRRARTDRRRRCNCAYRARVWGLSAVSEIRQLHLDAIASARRTIFAENQYFTSRLITDAFARRLREDNAPEIAVLSPFKQSGWLEISTMGVLRGRIHRRLRAADTNCRYRLYYPTLPWLDAKGECLNIHSKVFIVDDEFLMIGSANLADRSMGTDTECNVALERAGMSGSARRLPDCANVSSASTSTGVPPRSLIPSLAREPARDDRRARPRWTPRAEVDRARARPLA
jgi:phosphatidylserine/phosphatidylglycerophosphate/cardiolipin synthase-like enzyme